MTSILLGKQLDKIEDAAEHKADEIEKINYNKYHTLYDIAINFFKKAPVLMYGGMALNDILPSELKFYPEYTLPDIDVFCKNPQKIAKQLLTEYIRLGYKIPAFKEALHPGTWKVFVEGLQVADISQVTKQEYAILNKNTVRGDNGIRVVNREYLRLSLHIMLSQPYDAHRWGKVFRRLIAFYSVYPVRPPSEIKQNKGNPQVYNFLKDSDYVICGPDLSIYTNAKSTGCGPIQILSDDASPKATAQKLADYLGPSINVGRQIPATMFIPDHIYVYDYNKPIAIIYRADACLSYVKIGDYRYASLHTMARIHLSLSLTGNKASKYISDKITNIIIEQSLKPSRRKILQQFPVECYGTQAGLITMRRNQIERIIK